VDPDPEPLTHILFSLDLPSLYILMDIWVGVFQLVFVIFIALLLSALFSGAESAFFSLQPSDLEELRNQDDKNSKRVIRLLTQPNPENASQKLLATILIANNLINVFIIIFAAYQIEYLLKFEGWLKVLVQVVVITILLLLFGEVIPKIYTTQNNIKTTRFMSRTIYVLSKLLSPFVIPLASSSVWLNRYIEKRRKKLSVEELVHAIDLTHKDEEESERTLLKGIIKFGSTTAIQIMTPRTEIKAINTNISNDELFSIIEENGFSRIPVYENSLDEILGVLYTKDLIPYLNNREKLDWRGLLRSALFIPEGKKIDDLLAEFKNTRIHMAIIVDEYGGTQGLVTMEDVIEEVFGEIKDEFDGVENIEIKKIKEKVYIADATITIQDLCKYMEMEESVFADVKGDYETLSGLLLELKKDIPEKGEEILHDNFIFTVVSADNRKIKKVRIAIQ
jgi:gliding motility-associated protein GldE